MITHLKQSDLKYIKEGVYLIASGYEWMCEDCDIMNTEIEVTKTVKCRRCNKVYLVEDSEHAIG